MDIPKPKFTFVEFDHHLLPPPVKAQIEDIVYPPRRYLGYRNSAIVKLKNGDTMPLLFLLAKLKKPDWNPKLEEPIWTDTNWYNATFANISFLPRRSVTVGKAGRPSTLNLGVPFGHPDYQRRYLERNKEKKQEYMRRAYVRKKMIAAALADQLGEVKPEGMPKDDFTDDMSSRLTDILTTQKQAVSALKKEVPTNPHSMKWSVVSNQRRYPFGDDDPIYDITDLELSLVPQPSRED